jgi:hypothetical protein
MGVVKGTCNLRSACTWQKVAWCCTRTGNSKYNSCLTAAVQRQQLFLCSQPSRKITKSHTHTNTHTHTLTITNTLINAHSLAFENLTCRCLQATTRALDYTGKGMSFRRGRMNVSSPQFARALHHAYFKNTEHRDNNSEQLQNN